jgi:hypothetical protein
MVNDHLVGCYRHAEIAGGRARAEIARARRGSAAGRRGK